MSDWSEYRFDALCDITRGSSPRPIHDYLGNVGMPWIKIADATSSRSRFIERTNECIKLEGVQASVKVHKGDLILSNSATPGLPRFVTFDACIHDGWMLLRRFRGISKEFAYWLLLNERPRLVAQGNGSVFTNLKTDILKSHVVRIPEQGEQKEIVALLDGLEDKIDLNRRMNETLEAMARAIFKDWFVDFGPTRAKMEGRAPYLASEIWAQFPDRLDDGGKPEGWRSARFGEFFKLERGLSYKGEFLTDTGKPMINLGCFVGAGRFEAAKLKPYSGEHRSPCGQKTETAKKPLSWVGSASGSFGGPVQFSRRPVVPSPGAAQSRGTFMDWARILAYVTGTVDQELLGRNEYLAAGNHQGKGNVLLFPRNTDRGREAPVRCRERLGGLLRYYHREAA